MIQQAIEKAGVLIEALPYIQRFRGETVVVKFGGSILDDKAGFANILKDVAFMECVGLRPIVVHGGGKAISEAMLEKGLKAHFVRGFRVTNGEAIEVVEQVLNHQINPDLCRIIETYETKAQAIHGNTIIEVVQHVETDPESGQTFNWGFVGDVTAIDTAAIRSCVENETVPVITPLGRGSDGQIYNINADVAAGAIARELHARKLVFLTDVPGLLHDPDDPSSLISTLHVNEVKRLIERGVISGGMLPKVNGALRAIEAGVRKTHIIDAGMPHSLLLELFTDRGVGTEIVT